MWKLWLLMVVLGTVGVIDTADPIGPAQWNKRPVRIVDDIDPTGAVGIVVDEGDPFVR